MLPSPTGILPDLFQNFFKNFRPANSGRDAVREDQRSTGQGNTKSFSVNGRFLILGPSIGRPAIRPPGSFEPSGVPSDSLRHRGDDAVVRMVNTMYRTKMYFEDAGKMKSMMNRRIPGSIQDEIQDWIKAALES